MKKALLTLVLIYSVMTLFSQHASIAVLKLDAGTSKLRIKTNEAVLAKLTANDQLDNFIYNWNGINLEYLEEYREDKEESACDYVYSYSFELYEDLTPDLKYKRDTSNKVLYAYYDLNNGYWYRVKMVDLRTGEIVLSSYEQVNMGLRSEKPRAELKISDYKKYFEGDPHVLKKKNPKKYDEGVRKIRAAYMKKLLEFFDKKSQAIIGGINSLEYNNFYPEIIPIEEIILEKNKVKRFSIPASVGAIDKKVSITLFHLDTIGSYVMSTVYGYYFRINDSDKSKHVIKSSIISKPKKAGEAYLAGKKLYCSVGQKGFSHKMGSEKEPIYLGVNLPKSGAGRDIENKLSECERIVLIERREEKLMESFLNRYKQEAFIDYDFEPALFGVKYLVSKKDNQIELINVENGRVIHTYEASERYKGLYDVLQGTLDLEMEVVSILESKKEKAKKLLLYSPLGFSNFENLVLDIYKIQDESVGGKTMQRRELISKGTVSGYRIQGNFIAELKVGGAEAELYEAIQDGVVLKFRNHAYELPFGLGTVK